MPADGGPARPAPSRRDARESPAHSSSVLGVSSCSISASRPEREATASAMATPIRASSSCTGAHIRSIITIVALVS